MGWFRRKPALPCRFRVTAVTPVDSGGRLVVNGMPLRRYAVTGLVETADAPPRAVQLVVGLGLDRTPQPGQVYPAEVGAGDSSKVRVQWSPDRQDQQTDAVRDLAQAKVVQDLAVHGSAEHRAGAMDDLGVALTRPGGDAAILEALGATLGTPVSMDIDENGVQRHLTAGGGGHLSSGEAAQLLRTGTAATATILAARRVPIPQVMLPGPEASLWDLDLEVHRADGSAYRAGTRTGYRTEARRAVLGTVGLTVPVRLDPDDDSRVAVDGATYDADHPDAPPG